VSTPSSIAKLASTAVHDPAKLPGMLAEPYKQLAKHPGKFLTEKPVSTLLMLAPQAGDRDSLQAGSPGSLASRRSSAPHRRCRTPP
jgi:hypothetical protein